MRNFNAQLGEALGEVFLLGLQRADERVARRFEALSKQGAGLGFSRLMAPIDRLGGELFRKSRVRQWDFQPATEALFETTIIALLAPETV